jgi:DNA-binding LacI/PurR family transcriptional regulator
MQLPVSGDYKKENKCYNEDNRKIMPSGRNKSKRLTIGIFLNTLYENYDLELWKSVRAACEKHDINVITISGGALNSPYYYHTHRTQIYSLVNKTNVDGIVSVSASIGNYTTPEKLADFFKKFNDIPLVSIGIKTGSYATILVDNKSGMFNLVEHFVNVHGYSKIAFIKGPDSNSEARLRTQAYMDVLAKYRLPINENLICQGDFDRFSGIEAVRTLIDDRKADFEALIAANDLMAIYAMKELQNRGIKVPERVAIGGFDNIKDNQYITPSLTTVTQPFDQIGEVAVQKIIEYYSGLRSSEEIIIPATIVIGESCGCSQLVLSSSGTNVKNNTVSRHVTIGITQESIEELVHSVHTNYHDSKINSVMFGWERELIRSLLLDLEANEKKVFLSTFSEILIKANLTEIEGLIWYNILDFIFSYFEKKVKNESGLQLLHDIWKDALKITGVLNIKKKVRNNMEN